MVISFSQLLEKKAAGQLDDKCLGYLSHITNGAERARDMISDILTFCRLDQVSNSYENIELSEICEQVKLTLQPTLEDKNAEFVWPQSLPKIVGVKSQIFQLIMNLVGNGIKFNRSPTPKVEITAENNEDHWLLKVNDNGIGIEEKYFHKLFHIFGRLNSKSEFPGTGVGLAICKKIVEQHDGAISIESNRGAGTTFVIKWTKFVSDNQHLN
jgi:light-regulated signal transduction histidine kinase (bacteriophytochrome)